MKRSTRQALIGLGGIALFLTAIVVLASRANVVTGLRADVLSTRRTEPGAVEKFTVSVRDTKGRVTKLRVDFGDGRVEDVDIPDEPCRSPLVREFTIEHAFDFTGFSTVAAQVTTGGCGGGTEEVEAIRTIEVRAVRR